MYHFTPSRCTDLHLSSTQFPSHLQLKLHLNSIHITYHLWLAYEMYISPPSMCTLIAIEVHWLPSHLHPGHLSLASWSSLTLILVTIIASQPHQGPIIPPSMPLSTPSMPLDSRLTSIQIESHPNPGPHDCISPPPRRHLTSSQAPIIASQTHTDTISNPPRFQNIHLTSILALSHLNPEPKNSASPSIHVPSHFHPGP